MRLIFILLISLSSIALGWTQSIDITSLVSKDGTIHCRYQIQPPQSRIKVLFMYQDKRYKPSTATYRANSGFGNVNGFEWDLRKQGININGVGTMIFDAHKLKPVSFNSAYLKSTLFPGLGHKNFGSGALYWGILGYGSIAAAYYFYNDAKDNYEKYKYTYDNVSQNTYFNSARDSKMKATLLAGTAITAWGMNYLTLWLKERKLKRTQEPVDGKYYYQKKRPFFSTSAEIFIDTRSPYQVLYAKGDTAIHQGALDTALDYFNQAYYLEPSAKLQERITQLKLDIKRATQKKKIESMYSNEIQAKLEASGFLRPRGDFETEEAYKERIQKADDLRQQLIEQYLQEELIKARE